jgi:hypothetical protein
MIAVVFAAAVVLAQAAPDAAAPATPPTATAPHGVSGVTVTGQKVKPGAPDPKEVICRREKVIGSLFPKETCARREDIADRQRLDQKTVRDAQALRPWKDPGG